MGERGGGERGRYRDRLREKMKKRDANTDRVAHRA